jgi:hypothetical protein
VKSYVGFLVDDMGYAGRIQRDAITWINYKASASKVCDRGTLNQIILPDSHADGVAAVRLRGLVVDWVLEHGFLRPSVRDLQFVYGGTGVGVADEITSNLLHLKPLSLSVRRCRWKEIIPFWSLKRNGTDIRSSALTMPPNVISLSGRVQVPRRRS